MSRPFLLAVLLLASACASRPVPVQPGAAPVLGPNQGILVFDVETNVPLERIAMSGVTAAVSLEPGRHLQLLVLDAGSYRWSHIEQVYAFGRMRLRWARDERWYFTVRPGHVNFVGSIQLRGYRILGGLQARVLNRSMMAYTDLWQRFRETLVRYPSAYSGWIRDDFIDSYVKAARAAAAEAAAAE